MMTQCMICDLYNYNDVIMSAVASQITSVSIVCATVGSGADQRKHQSSASRAFVRGIHRWPVNYPHKGPVTRKMFLFDDVIMPPWENELTHTFVRNVRTWSVYHRYKKCVFRENCFLSSNRISIYVALLYHCVLNGYGLLSNMNVETL